MTVFIAGAGPSKIDALTLRVKRLIQIADVIVHDRLVDNSVLNIRKNGCFLIDVGKSPGKGVRQEDINKLLEDLSKKYKWVLRLKGGDPFVFGRGGEEALYLLQKQINYRVVPGITSATLAPLVAGVPLTHRYLSAGFKVLSTRAQSLEDDNELDAISYVYLMGAQTQGAVRDDLIKRGFKAEDKAVIISMAGTFFEEVINCRIGELAKVSPKTPATIIAGPTINLGLNAHFGKLQDKKILVTRSYGKSKELDDLLFAQGANVGYVETSVIKPLLDQEILLRQIVEEELETYSWVVFSSKNAVELFFNVIKDIKQVARLNFGVIGKKTLEELAKFKIDAHYCPEAEMLNNLFDNFPAASSKEKVLYPCSEASISDVEAVLSSKGYEVKRINIYRPEPTSLSNFEIDMVLAADLVLTFSPSQMVGLKNIFDKSHKLDIPIITLGPKSMEEIKRSGFKSVFCANSLNQEALVEKAIEILQKNNLRSF